MCHPYIESATTLSDNYLISNILYNLIFYKPSEMYLYSQHKGYLGLKQSLLLYNFLVYSKLESVVIFITEKLFTSK